MAGTEEKKAPNLPLWQIPPMDAALEPPKDHQGSTTIGNSALPRPALRPALRPAQAVVLFSSCTSNSLKLKGSAHLKACQKLLSLATRLSKLCARCGHEVPRNKTCRSPLHESRTIVVCYTKHTPKSAQSAWVCVESTARLSAGSIDISRL